MNTVAMNAVTINPIADPIYCLDIQDNKSKRNLQLEREKYDNNRERLLDYQTNYNLMNRDKILDYQRQYYLDNKEKLNNLSKTRNKQRVDCPSCGKNVLKPSLLDHQTRPICRKRANLVATTSV